MTSNIAVKITADATALQTQFALASASSRAFSAELNNLAKQANAAGGATPALAAQMQQVAASMLAAKSQVSDLKDQMNTGTAGIQKYGSALGLAKQGLAAFGVSISAAAVVAFGKSVFDSAAEIQHQAEVLGLSTTAYQDFTKSAMLAGVSTDAVDTALKRFNAAQGAALSGTGNQAKAFNDLHVSAQLPAQQSLPAVAAALLSITDVARRSRDEVALFGRSGEELNPALEQWAEGTDTLTAKLSALGLMLDDKTVKAAHDAKVEMDTAWGQVDVAWAPAVVKFTSALADLVGWLGKYQEMNKALEGSLPKWLGASSSIFGGPGSSGPASSVAPQPSQAAAAASGSGGSPAPNWTDNADIEKAAQQAREIGDAREQIFEQANEKRLQNEEQINNVLLQIGHESDGQWLTEAFSLEQQRYEAALAGMQKREALDANDKVALAKDQADEAQLYQESSERKDTIYAQYLEKVQAMRAQDLQNFIQSEDKTLAAQTESLNQQYQAGTITSQQRLQQELTLTAGIEAEVLKRLDAEIAGLTAGTKAYDDAMKQRLDVEKTFSADMKKDQSDYVNAQTEALQPVTNAFDQMFDGIISGNETLGQIVARTAETMAEDWIKQEVKQATQTIITEQAKTDAVVAGAAAQSAAQSAGSATSSASSLGKFSAQIMNDAHVAAANTYAAVSAIPVVGPFLAPPAAAAAYAGVMAFDALTSFDVGTNFVPSNMVAQLHQGERVIPAADNSALMSALGGAGGNSGGGAGQPLAVTFQINALDTSSALKFINSNMNQIAKALQAHLKYNPSLAPG